MNQEEKMTNQLRLLYPMQQVSKAHELGQLKKSQRRVRQGCVVYFDIQNQKDNVITKIWLNNYETENSTIICC